VFLPESPRVWSNARMRRERIVFLAAVAVIAVHVLDDSFIQPEDGTSAGDHLVSGLVPLAALGIAAAVYPRARAGVRATIALIIGLFGIVAGLEGWHYTREVGASGDDYSGLVTLPAGVVLLLVAAVTLWRSRRSEGAVRGATCAGG
jgi:drug/metabolite transporter (DMT)-like permease